MHGHLDVLDEAAPHPPPMVMTLQRSPLIAAASLDSKVDRKPPRNRLPAKARRPEQQKLGSSAVWCEACSESGFVLDCTWVPGWAPRKHLPLPRVVIMCPAFPICIAGNFSAASSHPPSAVSFLLPRQRPVTCPAGAGFRIT